MLTSIVFAAFGHYVFGLAMTFTAVFLILLILVQRGKGGGLSGALGGMGGQSAFGTKAGDAFTKITIGASLLWILLCIGAVRFLGASPGAFDTDNSAASDTTDSGLDSTPDSGLLPDSDGSGTTPDSGLGTTSDTAADPSTETPDANNDAAETDEFSTE